MPVLRAQSTKAYRRHAWDIPGRRHGLGHRYGMCEHSSPNHKLSQALTALSSSQASRRLSVIVGDENILCKHRQRTQCMT